MQASQLVSQLLMDATVTHRLENQPEPTPVAPLAQEVVRRLSPDLSDRVSPSIAPDAAEAELDVDRVVLREAIRNLVDNALRYSEGEVEISIARDGPALDIAVRDRGPGIPDHEKPLVFGRFRRGEAGSRIDRGGSGLGLAIVARVAEAHRGAVLLRDREGGGLAVHLRLPAEATSASQPPAPDRRHVLALLALFTVIAGAFLGPARPRRPPTSQRAKSRRRPRFTFWARPTRGFSPISSAPFRRPIRSSPLLTRKTKAGRSMTSSCRGRRPRPISWSVRPPIFR